MDIKFQDQAVRDLLQSGNDISTILDLYQIHTSVYRPVSLHNGDRISARFVHHIFSNTAIYQVIP